MAEYVNVQNGKKGGGFESKSIPLYFSLDAKGHLILTLVDIKSGAERKIRCRSRNGASDIVNTIQKLYEVYDE